MNPLHWPRPTGIAPVLLLLFLLSGSAGAARGPRDQAEFEAFLEGFLKPRMEERSVPGCGFVLVKEGRIFLEKGFGYANLETRAPVDPRTTVFRVASISKPFTAAALMILVDRGWLDLDRDVNQYLTRFQVPETFVEPVTPRHLLSHTAGFDERYVGLHVRDRAMVRPMAEFLASDLPRRCGPPGRIYSYSNHGSTLAGYLVEEITGIEFAQFAFEEIFTPLEMESSSFILLPRLRAKLATAYDISGGRAVPVGLSHANVGPAGGLNATPHDISRFLIMQLERGWYRGQRILSEASIDRMHRRAFTHDPRLPGATLGFCEVFENQTRALRHTGFAPGYVSLLFMIPEERLGFFITSTCIDAYDVHLQFQHAFMDRYFPPPTLAPAPVRARPPPAEEMNPLQGQYLFVRHPRDTFDKLPVLNSHFAPEVDVAVEEDGWIRLTGYADVPIRARFLERWIFRPEDGGTLLGFKEAPDGSITHLLLEHTTGPGAFERIPWHQTRRIQRRLIFFYMVVFSLGYLLARRSRLEVVDTRSRLHQSARNHLGRSALLSLLTLLGQPLTLFPLEGGFPQHTYGVSPWIFSLQLLPIALVPTLISQCICVMWALRARVGNRIERWFLLFSTLTSISYFLFLEHWNLVGFRV